VIKILRALAMNIHDKRKSVIEEREEKHILDRSTTLFCFVIKKFSSVRISLPTAQKKEHNERCTKQRNEHGEQINSEENNYAIKRKTGAYSGINLNKSTNQNTNCLHRVVLFLWEKEQKKKG
jgi:hypothetical protein